MGGHIVQGHVVGEGEEEEGAFEVHCPKGFIVVDGEQVHNIIPTALGTLNGSVSESIRDPITKVIHQIPGPFPTS
ncbi:unnamed protein product [Cuscuta campestris]|uniref:Uncharacterized protein n=1 Tax=Cuscuta campestris TaxID=132261 RepID=A0A484KVJ3_9ASTE|nr:unnamed protein product [Cuscuta campestris]